MGQRLAHSVEHGVAWESIAIMMVFIVCGAAQAEETHTPKPAVAKKTQAAPLAGKTKIVSATKSAAVKSNQNQTAAAKEDDVKKSRRIVEGNVGYVSKRAISVEYETKPDESYEMLLPLSADLKLEGGLKSVTELKRGDRVKVGIEQANREVSGSGPVLLKTEALVIVLVQRASDIAKAPAEAKAVK